MKLKFEAIIKQITGAGISDDFHGKLEISEQFQPEEENSIAIARNLNAAFLILLSGDTHPLHREAASYFSTFESHPSWSIFVRFYNEGRELIHAEILNRSYDDEGFEGDVDRLYSWIINPENLRKKQATVELIHQLFFPEGVALCEDREAKIDRLREKRTISITRLNPSPIGDPAREVLFSSNILVTIPPGLKRLDDLSVSLYLKETLKRIIQEEQIYWYDHPIPIGVSPEHNEVLYGLEGLDKAVGFEKNRGTMDKEAKVTCILSVSVTHKGLHRIVKEYLEDELKKEKNIQHLEVYVFTESDTIGIIEEILLPAAEKYTSSREYDSLFEVFGVDGEYGRHYSFLKAVAAYWHVLIDKEIRGTFKIDLDQVFPQNELVEQSGLSAFEHFKTPLWGAEGTDYGGNSVELGMIAGALVNQKDIGRSLFTPDVCFPPDHIKAEELVFFSSLPQALSTEAEMMTRYGDNHLDGKNRCIQRIHVTGGTCGILIDSLRRFKPFTPTFIGRAEDQAYLLSILFDGDERELRYVHKDGLIMRHDKEAFAGEAIKMAATGKMIGDYIRILMFSYYVKALPWSFEEIKDTIDPFTGCFVSRIPLTVVYLRFALKAASFFREHSYEKKHQGYEFMQTGVKRLQEAIGKLARGPNPLIGKYNKEKQGWGMFYDILEKMERNIRGADPFAIELQEKAKKLVAACRISLTCSP